MLSGDFNVIPEPIDAANPAAWANDALFQPESRAKLRALIHLGLTDAVRACSTERALYVLGLPGVRVSAEQRHPHRPPPASPQAADRLTTTPSARRPAAGTSPSDHVPVMVDLDLD